MSRKRPPKINQQATTSLVSLVRLSQSKLHMRNIVSGVTIAGLLFVTGGAFAQTTPKLAFEVASVKPAAPLNMQKIQDAVKNGGPMPIGPHIEPTRAEFTYMALRELIVLAYKVKPYQISGPDWVANERFDVVAKYPDGATKQDVPKMLQALLEDRFKLAVHRETKEHPVLALVVGKGGSKLKDSGVTPPPIDENAPLKPGEISLDTANGPARMTVDPKTGGGTMNMGEKGSVTYKMDMANMMMHMNSSQVTMTGFADTLSQFFTLLGGGRQVVDMTELKGHYEVALDISLADMIAAARAQGMDVPPPPPGAPGAGADANAASDPGRGMSLTDAVAAIGLKLEQRKAAVEQLIIDHIEKTPTEN
jgi:uncharacterized protein (TIGR03435 family)